MGNDGLAVCFRFYVFRDLFRLSIVELKFHFGIVFVGGSDVAEAVERHSKKPE